MQLASFLAELTIQRAVTRHPYSATLREGLFELRE